jgi:hypothetical protein
MGPQRSPKSTSALRPWSDMVLRVGVLEGLLCDNGDGTPWVGLA